MCTLLILCLRDLARSSAYALKPLQLKGQRCPLGFDDTKQRDLMDGTTRAYGQKFKKQVIQRSNFLYEPIVYRYDVRTQANRKGTEIVSLL